VWTFFIRHFSNFIPFYHFPTASTFLPLIILRNTGTICIFLMFLNCNIYIFMHVFRINLILRNFLYIRNFLIVNNCASNTLLIYWNRFLAINTFHNIIFDLSRTRFNNADFIGVYHIYILGEQHMYRHIGFLCSRSTTE
jgi:hypothetical protein